MNEQIQEIYVRRFHDTLDRYKAADAPYYDLEINDTGSACFYDPGANGFYWSKNIGAYRPDGLTTKKPLTKEEESEVYDAVKIGRVQVTLVASSAYKAVGMTDQVYIKAKPLAYTGPYLDRMLNRNPRMYEQMLQHFWQESFCEARYLGLNVDHFLMELQDTNK